MTFQKDAKTETQTLEALLRAGTTTSKGIFFCENNLDNLTGFYWGRLNRVGGWVGGGSWVRVRVKCEPPDRMLT